MRDEICLGWPFILIQLRDVAPRILISLTSPVDVVDRMNRFGFEGEGFFMKLYVVGRDDFVTRKS